MWYCSKPKCMESYFTWLRSNTFLTMQASSPDAEQSLFTIRISRHAQTTCMQKGGTLIFVQQATFSKVPSFFLLQKSTVFRTKLLKTLSLPRARTACNLFLINWESFQVPIVWCTLKYFLSEGLLSELILKSKSAHFFCEMAFFWEFFTTKVDCFSD